MNDLEPISIRAVKREARALYRGRFKTAIQINIFPIVMTLMTTFSFVMISYGVFTHLNNLSVVVGTDNSNLDQGVSIIKSVLSDAITLMFTWSAYWALIDWYEKPTSLPKMQSGFQIFRLGNVLHTFILSIVQSILIFLWTLLFVIPGIIKYYAYSQTYFVYKIDVVNGKQQRQLTDYIKISQRIMKGRKWELFLLELSFIGWHLLGVLTCGLAYIYVVPYLNATRVAYSRHLLTLTLNERKS